MTQYKFKTFSKQLLADTLTPVNIYLKLRDVFAASILLESSDYHGQENSLSFICCDPVALFEANKDMLKIEWPDGSREQMTAGSGVLTMLEKFQQAFAEHIRVDSKYIHFGFFGYTSYDAVQFFEDVSLKTDAAIPLMQYKFYRYVIVIDHFSNELTLFEHAGPEAAESSLDKLIQIIYSHRISNLSLIHI